jgi:transposase
MGVGRAVLLAFGPARPDPWARCTHNDGDIWNNAVENLTWGGRLRECSGDHRCRWCDTEVKTKGLCSRCRNLYHRHRVHGSRVESQTRLSASHPIPRWELPILRGYLKGKLLCGEAAQSLGVSRSAILSRAKRLLQEEQGVKDLRSAQKASRRRQKLKREHHRARQSEAVQHAVEKGARLAAERYGVCPRTILRWKARHGCTGVSTRDSTEWGRSHAEP